ncbi:MAG: DUF2461 domain-containing protein [Rikenellaceae bacterium]
MQKIINFLNQLQQNNNRLWFEEHKEEYKEVQATFNTFVEALIAGITDFDSSIKNLTIKDCTYRIYRDIRFSNDKTPYKTHMGAFIAPHGKSGGYSGYYFHIEAKDANYIGGHLLSTGIYHPNPIVVKSIREEIMLNGEQLDKVIKSAEGFAIDFSDALKRVPRGFSSDSKYAEYFKLRDYFLAEHLDEAFIMSENLLENTLREFKKTLLFNNWMNKAAEYAYENMR